MPIYHFSAKPISRSSGRSSTAAAAYRAAVEITDERTGQVHDFRKKRGVESADLILPADAPEWASDRAKFWNGAEASEKRKDACTARELELALPAELSREQRRALALDFARELADTEGCGVDVGIHLPSRTGSSKNHHAHMLRSTRKIGPDGFGEKLNTERAGRNKKADLEQWRARWAQLTNEHLERAGLSVRVDHRSLADQGITDREPERHIGPTATGYERRTGDESDTRMRHEGEIAAGEIDEIREAGTEVDQEIFGLESDLAELRKERAAQAQAERAAESAALLAGAQRIIDERRAALTLRQQQKKPPVAAAARDDDFAIISMKKPGAGAPGPDDEFAVVSMKKPGQGPVDDDDFAIIPMPRPGDRPPRQRM